MVTKKLIRWASGIAMLALFGSLNLAPARAAGAVTIAWDTTLTEGASYAYGSVPAEPTCTAADADLISVPCVVSDYAATVGTHTVTATAGEATSSITYTVTAWTLKGFQRPVKMNVWNRVKGGSVVPLKFKVYAGATKITDKAAIAGFTSQLVSCTDASPLAEPVALPTAGRGLGLRYRDHRFVKNWKTPKVAVNTTTETKQVTHGKKTVTVTKKIRTKVPACYLVTVTTADGSSLSARFTLK